MYNEKIFQELLQIEIACFSTFAQSICYPWGSILFNTELKERHDANHAEVVKPIDDYKQILETVTNFYREKDLVPRINFYHPDINHPFKKALMKFGYKSFSDQDPRPVIFMIYNTELKISVGEHIDLDVRYDANVSEETKFGQDVSFVLKSEWEYQNIAKDPNYKYFVLYQNDKPVSVLSLFYHEETNRARIDDVFTLKEERQKGFSSYLLKHAIKDAVDKGFTPHLYVLEENAYKIYKSLGFRDYTSVTFSGWFLDN